MKVERKTKFYKSRKNTRSPKSMKKFQVSKEIYLQEIFQAREMNRVDEIFQVWGIRIFPSPEVRGKN